MTTTITHEQATRIAAAMRARGSLRHKHGAHSALESFRMLDAVDREFWMADTYRVLKAGDVEVG